MWCLVLVPASGVLCGCLGCFGMMLDVVCDFCVCLRKMSKSDPSFSGQFEITMT